MFVMITKELVATDAQKWNQETKQRKAIMQKLT